MPKPDYGTRRLIPQVQFLVDSRALAKTPSLNKQEKDPNQRIITKESPGRNDAGFDFLMIHPRTNEKPIARLFGTNIASYILRELVCERKGGAMRTTLIVYLVCASTLLSAVAYSGEVMPLSYMSVPLPGKPDSGGELTDGVYGPLEHWDTAWQGWNLADPVVTFTFGSLVKLEKIDVHVLKNTGAGIRIPSRINVTAGLSSYDWYFNDGSVPNYSNPLLSLPIPGGGVITNNIQLTLYRTGSWIFCSEMDFYGQPELPVPEPSGLLALASGLVAAGAVLRRRLA